ncbi:MAG: hypothetical protein ACXWPM_09590 [Bdellovibrionota bacterium]
MSRELCALTGAQHIEVDRYFALDRENFLVLVEAALQGTCHWIIEGHFKSTRAIVFERVDSVIWLDLPARVIFTRWFLRALRRRGFSDWKWAVLKMPYLARMQREAVAEFQARGIPVLRARSTQCAREIGRLYRIR